MKVSADGLAALLARAERDRKLASVFLVTGDESLLSLEAQDAIRATARRMGFMEREVLQADARFDWSRLAETARAQSLFSERRIVELRLPTGKPGVAGAAALEAHAARVHADLLTIVALPRLDRRAREARWVAALEGAGVLVDIESIERAQLPAWIARRLARQQQKAPAEALDFIADRVEGNLLAAHQEICKLGLLYPPGNLSLQQVHDAVLNVARYNVFQLPIAMLGGDASRIENTLAGLRAEGEAIPLVLWAIVEELRMLLRVRAQTDAGRPFPAVARDNRLWGPREKLVEWVLPRLDVRRLTRALARGAEIDRLAKGLRPKAADSDPWLELADLALSVARTSH
jgi:DNA polymerase-3 subunit delta